MATILDALKAQQNAPVQAAGKAGTGTTSKIQQVINQVRGGAAAAQPAAPQQNLLEQAAVGQAQTAAQQQQGQAELQQAGMAEQAAGQQQQFQQQSAQLSQRASAVQDQAKNKTNALLQEAEQSRGQLDLAKQRAKAEQLAFNMRLSNDKYIKRLQSEGQVRRLGDKNAFEEATVKSLFDQEQNLFKDQLDFNEALTMDELSWQERLQQVDMENWLQEAKMLGKQQSAQQMTQGMGGMVSAGTEYAVNRDKKGAE